MKLGQEPDLIPEAGMIKPTELPTGASAFGDPLQAGLTGHYFRLAAGIELSEGLAVTADGIDVGGVQPPTHHTIYPTREMSPEDFLNSFRNLPWEYAGKLK